MKISIINPPHSDRIHDLLLVPGSNQVHIIFASKKYIFLLLSKVWTGTRGTIVTLWKIQPIQLSQSISIAMEKKWELNSIVKGMCLMSDQGHVFVGTFDGTAYMWNIQVFIYIY